MLSMLLTAWALVAVCVAIHAMGLTAAFASIKRREGRFANGFWSVTLFLTLVAVWAVFYVQTVAIADFKSAAYFSAITCTATGYGDILLPEDVRIFSGVEALTGMVMCGLTTGMFLAVFARLLGLGAMGAAHERS